MKFKTLCIYKLFIISQVTSENVKEADLNFFLLANITAETASLELVANGNATNEMKNLGIFVAREKLSTASTKGSANAAAIMDPSSKSSAALNVVHRGFLTSSTTSSLRSPNPKRSCFFFVCCKIIQIRHNTQTKD